MICFKIAFLPIKLTTSEKKYLKAQNSVFALGFDLLLPGDLNEAKTLFHGDKSNTRMW